MTNNEIARLFDRLAGLYEMQPDGGFKARAYRKGAQAIRGLPDELTAIVASGADLKKVPGIGAAIDAKVRELLDTGRIRTYDREAGNVSPLALALLDVPGIGGASVRRLLDETGADSPADLLAALDAGAGAWLPATGPRSVQAVRELLAAPHHSVRPPAQVPSPAHGGRLEPAPYSIRGWGPPPPTASASHHPVRPEPVEGRPVAVRP